MKAKFIFLLPIFILALAACSDNGNDGKDPEDPTTGEEELTDTELTNKWAYRKMQSLYLWNTELPTSLDYTQDPEDFFYGILYNYGNVNGDRFSWIEEDTSKGTKSLYAGSNLGFEYIPMSYFASGSSSLLGFFVVYVYNDSDAYSKGLRRGQVIYKVNDTDVSYDNYGTILENVTSLSLSVYNNNGKQEKLETIQASEGKKSPVFISKIIPGTKIGYLVYTGFERGPDENDTSNYEYDIELIESISALNSQGITDFVLDLRYNPGGYLTSAMDLASALVPNRKTSNIFAKEEYNTFFQDSITNKLGKDALNEYFLDKAYGTSTSIPQLSLSKLYVLTSNYTASASELVIHGLKPYMTVFQIGETTVGKDKASMTVQSDDSRIKWQLQPIISRLTDANGEGNYINGLTPDSEISEWAEGYTMQSAYYIDDDGSTVYVDLPRLSTWIGGLTELGDPSEPLLAEAIAQITTGTSRVKAAKSVKSGGVAVKVPKIKYKEHLQRIIIDQDKFSNLNSKSEESNNE
jgi:C-terminal processing protease CtpA/Prc